MRAIDIIQAKRDGADHTAAEIDWLVGGYTRGDIPDYQMSAWLMAVVLRGMTDDETFALTNAMWRSGGTLDLTSIASVKVDKHSTGGVGDKTTLAVVPLLAAAGVTVAKLSGRGLGHTGGTLDKLDSIPGFRTSLTEDEIVRQVATVGACICGATDRLAPADRKMYALRDVTGTVESLPLIAASIISKKLAAGADALVFDVKVGKGAFMKTRRDALALATMLARIGKRHGKRVIAAITAMDAPLGSAIGNWLEVREVVDLLSGHLTPGGLTPGPSPSEWRGGANSGEFLPQSGNSRSSALRDEIVALTAYGLELAGKGGAADVERLIDDGSGWRKLCEIVEAQGGDVASLKQERRAPIVETVAASAAGYVAAIDAYAVGVAAMRLGAGRETKDQAVDPLAGIVLRVGVGSRVAAGDVVAELHTSREGAVAEAAAAIGGAIRVSRRRPRDRGAIIDVVDSATIDL